MEPITESNQDRLREIYEELEMIVVQSPLEAIGSWRRAEGKIGDRLVSVTQVCNLVNRTVIFVSSSGPSEKDFLNKSVTRMNTGVYYLESGPLPGDLIDRLKDFEYKLCG